MQIKLKNLILLIFLFLINLILISCKDNSINVTSISNKDNSIYEKFILNIDKEPYEELEWITLEPTGGVILYNGYKFLDINNDGKDELFIFRQYVNPKKRIPQNINSFNDFLQIKIKNGFVSEAYTIENNEVKPLMLDGEMVDAQAFRGGHFGVYYFLLNDGRLVKFYNSYFNETLILYNNMKQESILSYNFDNEIGEWWWELDNKKVSRNEALKFLNDLLE